MVLNGKCVTVVTAEGCSNQLSLADFQGFCSELHQVIVPGISFLNICSQSRLEENSIKWFW